LGSRGLLGPLRVNKGSSKNRQHRGRKNRRERRQLIEPARSIPSWRKR
jgi:hypothetical protein